MTVMPSVNDQQFETILLRLESGESLRSIQSDFPELASDIEALQDLQDFFAAQRLVAKPDPQGLKSVLRQVNLIQQAQGDDEDSWGAFFTGLFGSGRVALPALLVLGVSGYVWQSQLPAAQVSNTDTLETVALDIEAMPAVASRSLEASSVASNQASRAMVADEPSMDMDALVQSLSNEFASDMADFEQTKERLEPLFSEELFSSESNLTLWDI